jgi:Flp pilus assembly pilin Flp
VSKRLKLKFEELLRDETGATAIEYVLIASVMGLAIIPAMANFSGEATGLYGRILGYFVNF